MTSKTKFDVGLSQTLSKREGHVVFSGKSWCILLGASVNVMIAVKTIAQQTRLVAPSPAVVNWRGPGRGLNILLHKQNTATLKSKNQF